jgi:hypothetical protein
MFVTMTNSALEMQRSGAGMNAVEGKSEARRKSAGRQKVREIAGQSERMEVPADTVKVHLLF